jgi:signal transduction histidine kinase
MSRSKLAGAVFGAVALIGTAFAAEVGSPDEAKAMADRAAAYIKANGAENAFKTFNDKQDANFHDRDLYVFVFDPTGKVLSHGANANLVAKNMAELKDVDGKPFVKEFLAVKDTGWVDYKWQNPQSKAVEAKTTYVVRSGDYVIGVGAYKR